MHKKTRKASRTVLIAAALAVVLVGSAFAAWSIHSARQQELREDLQIDENNVAGYTEYAVPEKASGLVLLSALNEGDTERAYINISPIEEEEFASYLHGREFRWTIDGTEYSGFADPKLPDGVILEGFENIRAGVLQYSYDKDSKTLTLVCYLKTAMIEEAMKALGSDTVPLSVELVEGENAIHSFGPIPLALTEAQKTEFDFGRAVYHDTEFNKNMEIVGLELTPFRAEWKVRFAGEPSDVIREGFDAPLPDWTLMEEKLCKEAKITFSDGSSFSTGGAIGSIQEGDSMILPCSWNAAINIDNVESIVFDDLILWKR